MDLELEQLSGRNKNTADAIASQSVVQSPLPQPSKSQSSKSKTKTTFAKCCGAKPTVAINGRKAVGDRRCSLLQQHLTPEQSAGANKQNIKTHPHSLLSKGHPVEQDSIYSLVLHRDTDNTNHRNTRAAVAVGETNKLQRNQGGAAPARTRAATQSE